MDNTTRVISSNETPYEKLFGGSNGLTAQKTAPVTTATTTTMVHYHHQQHRYDNRKGFVNTGGPMYTIGNGNGQAQILMNTPSLVNATNMQFMPPTRTKATLSSVHDYCLPAMPAKSGQSKKVSYLVQSSQSEIILPSSSSPPQYEKAILQPQMGPATYVTKSTFPWLKHTATTMARISSTRKMQVSKLVIEQKVFVQRTSGPIIEQNPKYFTDMQGKGVQSTTGGEQANTLVNTIKNCVFNYLIKPIIDTTTMFVGTDNNGKTTKTSNNATTTTTTVWNDMKATAGGSPTNNNHHHHQQQQQQQQQQQHNKSTGHAQYTDCNHSSDRFYFNYEKPNYFTNYMPDKFFDCDDYIDGGEDTIDFVADSTNIQYNRFGAEIDPIVVQQPSPKDHIFYDCVNKFEHGPSVVQHEEEKIQQKATTTTIADEYLDVVSSSNSTKQPDDNDNADIVENVQYDEVERSQECGKSPINCPKYEKPNPKSYRRKRRGKRKQQQQQHNQNKSNHHRATKGNGQKNRHEKIRHEVEQNIHEDIDDCSVVKDCVPDLDDDDDDDDGADLEIIDLDDDDFNDQSPKSPTLCSSATVANAVTTKSSPGVCIETPIPSPETIKSGCIFTQFFRLDNSNCKKKSVLPLYRCSPMQKQVPQPSKTIRERPVTCRRTSETSESDDSFIVFEDSSPKASTSYDDLMPKSNGLKDTYKRQRQISECSDGDDFILFQDDIDDLCRRYDTTDEDFTDSTDDSDNSDDESGDESDSSDCSSISQRKPHDGESNQPDSGFEEKKVTFNLCPTVHEIRAWKFAYSQARKGKWEQMGRDRERFEKRINGLDRILSPILAPKHRQKIYEQRFRSEDAPKAD